MEAVVLNSPLNATQIHFLQTLQFVKTSQMMQELQQVVSDFYFKKMNEEADTWWDENNMTTEKFEEMCNNINYRTPCK
jgi:hypothetical protein